MFDLDTGPLVSVLTYKLVTDHFDWFNVIRIFSRRNHYTESCWLAFIQLYCFIKTKFIASTILINTIF